MCIQYNIYILMRQIIKINCASISHSIILCVASSEHELPSELTSTWIVTRHVKQASIFCVSTAPSNSHNVWLSRCKKNMPHALLCRSRRWISQHMHHGVYTDACALVNYFVVTQLVDPYSEQFAFGTWISSDKHKNPSTHWSKVLEPVFSSCWLIFKFYL